MVEDNVKVNANCPQPCVHVHGSVNAQPPGFNVLTNKLWLLFSAQKFSSHTISQRKLRNNVQLIIQTRALVMPPSAR